MFSKSVYIILSAYIRTQGINNVMYSKKAHNISKKKKNFLDVLGNLMRVHSFTPFFHGCICLYMHRALHASVDKDLSIYNNITYIGFVSIKCSFSIFMSKELVHSYIGIYKM